MSEESEKIMQQLAQRMADDMMAALCGANAFQKPTALRVNSFGAFEVVDLDDDGKIVEPMRCYCGPVLHRPNCPFFALVT